MAYSEYTPAFLFFITNSLPNHHLPAITDFHFFLFLIRFLLQKYNIFSTRARKTRICCSSAIVWNKNGTKKKHPQRQKFAAAIAAHSYGNCIIQNNQWPLHENY